MSWNVFVTRKIPVAGVELLRKHCRRVDQHDSEIVMDHAAFLREARDCDGLLVTGGDRIDKTLFDAAPRLKVVSTMAVGYDNVDVAEATRRKVAITNTPDVLTEACADLTWALILAAARRVVEGDQLSRSGKWPGWSPVQLLGADFVGKTLGIVGGGRIGTAVARRAKGFSMRVLYFSRKPNPEIGKLGAQHTGFDQVLQESDYVSVHVPLTTETRHMFGEKEFRKMKPTAFFINMARGPVHDEAALLRALQEGWIAGAGLDVYENEPQLTPGLTALPNVVLLPHLGSATTETRTRMAALAAENLLTVLRGDRCPHVVNPEVL